MEASVTTPMRTDSCGVWMSAFAVGDSLFSSPTTLAIADSMRSEFDLGGAKGSHGPRPAKSVADWRSWLADAIDSEDARIQAETGVSGQVSVFQERSKRILWSIESFSFAQYRVPDAPYRADPALFIGVDLELARTPCSTRSFIAHTSRHLLRDNRVWYAFIDPAPRSHVPHPVFYSGGGGWVDKHRWERLVEQARWHDFAMRDRDRVRGVFWGNILGPDFARRVRDAGYDDLCNWMDEQYGHRPVTITDPSTGSMAILLDDDPVAFAQTRDTGEMDLGSMNRSVKTGALVWEVFSKAGLL